MSNWVAYNAIDEMKRLEPELALLRELGEAAKYWLSIEEATGVPVTKDSQRMAYAELVATIGEYQAWEQDL